MTAVKYRLLGHRWRRMQLGVCVCACVCVCVCVCVWCPHLSFFLPACQLIFLLFLSPALSVYACIIHTLIDHSLCVYPFHSLPLSLHLSCHPSIHPPTHPSIYCFDVFYISLRVPGTCRHSRDVFAGTTHLLILASMHACMRFRC